MKSSPSPPPAPDYAGAARAQGAANVETAKIQGRINNPNIVSPYGSQTVDWGPGTTDQKQYDAVMSAWNAGQPWTFQGQDTRRMPTVADFTTYGDQPTVTQTLNSESQKIFNQQQAVRLGLADLGQQGLGTAQNALNNQFNFNGPAVQTSLGNQPAVQDSPNLFGLGSAGANVQAGQGTAGTPNLFGLGQAGSNTNAGQGIQGSPNPFSYGAAGTTSGAGQGLSYGPQVGQYGYAQQGVNAPILQGQVGNAGPIQVGPNAGLFGLAQGGPGYQQAQGINAGQYGQAAGVSGAGQGIAGAPNTFQFGQAGGNVAAGQGMADTPNLFGL